MPDKQLYIDGANGVACIVGYGNATNARTDPLNNLDDVYLHSDLQYLQFQETITGTVYFSDVPRSYYTWSDGGKGGLCFLTTACVEYMGLDDYCDELLTLRRFRDKHMMTNVDGAMKVMWYYDNAPTIVRNLKARNDAKEVFCEMFRDYIKPSVDAIDAGDMKLAEEIYERGVRFSAEKAGVPIGKY